MSDDSILERAFRKIHNQLLAPFDEGDAEKVADPVPLPAGNDARVDAIHARKVAAAAGYPEVDSDSAGLS